MRFGRNLGSVRADSQGSPNSDGEASGPPFPLCIDLDGTLVRSDTLLELIALFIKRSPVNLILIFVWALGGRARLKRNLSSRVSLNVATLPYNAGLIERLRSEREHGRYIVLATGSDQLVAEQISNFLGIFDEVIASDGVQNKTGSNKRDALVTRFGSGGFDYAGNGRVDFTVWRAARTPIIVNAGSSFARLAFPQADRTLSERSPQLPALFRALRPYQWTKNLLIFLPLILSHRVFERPALLADITAFIAFSVCASSIYLVNDILDLESDRAHRSKKHRPLAAGRLRLDVAFIAAPLCAALAFALAARISAEFVVVLGGYLALTLAYSFFIKRIVLLDVLVLAGLYTTRIVAGSVVTGIVNSFWLLAFALFMFASLAMLKRYSELASLRETTLAALNGRDYTARDAEMVAMLGIASGFSSVLVVALYINGDVVRSLYAHPSILWAICPLLLYWISRAWLIAHRGDMNDDPILFALKDRPSLLIVALCLIAGVLATARNLPLIH